MPTDTSQAVRTLPDAITALLERAGDHAMRTHEVDLALECYALALRIRYVTAGEEIGRDDAD